MDNWRVTLAQFRIALAVNFQYRFNNIIWMLGLMVDPVVYLAVWSAVAKMQGGSVGGYSAGEFASYYILLTLVRHITAAPMGLHERRIVTGELSALLLRPVHPVYLDIADDLAYKTITLLGLIPLAILLIVAFEPSINLTWSSALLFVPTILLAAAMRFTLQYTLGMIAFWTTRFMSIFQVYLVAQIFFAGRLAPLDLMPEPLRAISYLLPFRWVEFHPIEMLLGRLSSAEIAQGLAAQVCWLLVAYGAFWWLWRAGIKRYSAVGG